MKKYLLILFVLISLFFSFYKIDQVPPCINADEAAFGYNSYSLLKTARDEYGAFMPLRLVSFRDFKLPLYSYLSVPFIAIFGLNDFSTKALNILIAALYVPLMYFLIKELCNKKDIALIGAFITSFSPWIFILTRHAHEGPLSVLLILTSIYFYVKFEKKPSLKLFILTDLAILLSTYSYQSARLFFVAMILLQLATLIIKNRRIIQKKYLPFIVVLLVSFIIAFFPDIKYGVNRVQNLFFLKNPGFVLRLNEYIGEHPNRIIHNKLTEGIRDVTNRYMTQISPEFLTVRGDNNYRFGFENMGLITPIEYGLIFVGLYYLFLHKERYRYLIVLLLLISPFPNALTWQGASLIRTYILIFPIIICTSYGLYYLFHDVKNSHLAKQKLFMPFISIIFMAGFGFYLYNNWDLYFNHYPKRALTVRAWQCGYKELASYVKDNYDSFDNFVITDRQGQPYIFFLYYLKLDPSKYQMQSKISGPDKYGFGQVTRYDKFDFIFHFDKTAKRSVYIGYPDEFNELPIDITKIKKIKIGTEEMFWIYET